MDPGSTLWWIIGAAQLFHNFVIGPIVEKAIAPARPPAFVAPLECNALAPEASGTDACPDVEADP